MNKVKLNAKMQKKRSIFKKSGYEFRKNTYKNHWRGVYEAEMNILWYKKKNGSGNRRQGGGDGESR